MILPDANLLIYAFNSSAPLHKRAAAWWEQQLNEAKPVGVCWPVFQAFLRLLTSRTIVEEPYTAAELFEVAGEWWVRPTVRLLAPTSQTYRIYRGLMETYALSGNAATDALIAAFALEHGGRLVTNDTDFFRFEDLTVENPLCDRQS